MAKKILVIVILIAPIVFGIIGCKKPVKQDEQADMYQASELSLVMRTMVDYSKACKAALEAGESLPKAPDQIWTLQQATATRGENNEDAFQSMTSPYLEAVRGIERGDSQAYYYARSIDACVACHSTYCGGPMSIIQKLKP